MTNLAVMIVAGTLMAEAGAEPVAGMQAVAEVIAVRMIERKLDAVSVCLEARQFCCWNRGFPPMQKRIAQWEKGKSAKWKYAKVLAGELIVGKGIIGEHRFNHFYRPGKANPVWRLWLRDTQKIGHHVFGRIASKRRR